MTYVSGENIVRKKIRNVLTITHNERRKIIFLTDENIRKRFYEKVIELVDIEVPIL